MPLGDPQSQPGILATDTACIASVVVQSELRPTNLPSVGQSRQMSSIETTW